MGRKKVCICVVLLSIFMLCSTTVFATGSDIPNATSQFYVNDFANIISDDVEREMQEKAVALAESSDGIQVVVTTVQTIGDADPIYYTVDMYNKYGIGKNNMGVLIMLSVETRDIQVRLGHNMTKYLSDRKSGEIIDKYGIPYFKNDEFAEGLYEMQNATIEYITSKVQSAENEVTANPTEMNAAKDNGFFGTLFNVLATSMCGVLSFFGLDKFLKNRKEKKTAEEVARIQFSQEIETLKERNQNLEAELIKREELVKAKDREIYSLNKQLKDTQKELVDLEGRYKRAVIAYPDLNEMVEAIYAKEREEADKQIALEVEEILTRVLSLECTRQNLHQFKNAYNAFERLTTKQREYVPAELVNLAKEYYDKSSMLQRKFEEAERIRRDKEKAAQVQELIMEVISSGISRHSLSKLTSVCREYEALTGEQKKYVNADVQTLYEAKRKAKRLQEEYQEQERLEEERRRRRQREEEERRRRASYSSSSFGGGRHSGFGGSSGGHGAGRKF